jgi:hypothetical protein
MVGHELQDRLVIQFAMASVFDLDGGVFDAKIGQQLIVPTSPLLFCGRVAPTGRMAQSPIP